MKVTSILFIFLTAFVAFSAPTYAAKSEVDSFYDHKQDYSVFPGRVTDRDKTGNVFKIYSESNNVKFFRSGDSLQFVVARGSEEKCTGYVRSTEDHYFVLFVKDLYPCWSKGEYFRIGTQLTFYSETFSERVQNASSYRLVLMKRREDFLRQLNELNNFLWAFEEKKVQLTSNYDQKIVQMQTAKQKAIDNLNLQRKDSVVLQKELIKRLDQLERDIDRYRVENQELYSDRWHLDQDLGLPVGKRPPAVKRP